MIKKSTIILFSATLMMISCNSGNKDTSVSDTMKTETTVSAESNEVSQNQSIKESTEVKKGPKYNYVGSLGGMKIKAQVNYEEATHAEGTGAIQIPISGYYFYETVKVEIPIKGTCNGIGNIWITAFTEGGEETFEGQFTNAQLGDFTGTWSKDNKSLPFSLTSLE